MKCNFENCGYYTDGECNICGMGISGEDTFCRLCKDNPKCYYKQLAELKAYKDVNEDFKTAWEELKAENTELREKLEGYKNGIKKV